ncbi:MAG: hypothetical protein J6V53_00140 [Alphaproteobacteria bacterium]|nr:hypothetical protein [Alphaproteobacteria bacterium]
MNNNLLKTATALSLVVLLSGCGLSQKERFEAFSAAYQQADFCTASNKILEEENVCEASVDDLDVEDYDLDAKLNAGTALFLSKKPELSNALFEQSALEIKEGLESNGLARGAVEVVANASLMDYNPMIMDGIYLHTYTTLNALALANKDEAKIQIQRAHESQVKAVEAYKKEIEEQKEAAKKESELDKLQEKAIGKNVTTALESYKGVSQFKGYADFVNPYMNYLSGLYYLTNAQDPASKENAVHEFKKVYGMLGKNSFVKDDLKTAESLADNKISSIDPTAWVIFENGMIANLDEFRIDLPVFIATDKVKTASLALPIPKEREEAYPNISISNGSKTVKTEVLTNMDNIFMGEFNKKLPSILFKAITKLTVQTIAQVAAQNKFGDLGGIAAAGYSVLTAGADTRSWYSLPKNIQLAKIKKSSDGQLKLTVGGQTLSVEVPAEGHSLIHVRVPYKGTVPTINVFGL